MRVILSKQCVSLTGMLRTDLGYYLRSTKKGNFYSQRSKHGAPPDGHWRFIVLCAELAQNKLYVTDIRLLAEELEEALQEAGHYVASQNLRKTIYDARDVLNLKTTFGL